MNDFPPVLLDCIPSEVSSLLSLNVLLAEKDVDNDV